MPLININHLKIFYYDNKLEGIPLVFIHGWLGSSLEWKYQLYHFNLKNHIILLDLPGFGKSDKPREDYTIEFYTKQIIDLLKLLKYNKVILIGHSLGGLIAQDIVLKKPKIVKKLILISSTSGKPQSILERIMIFWINILFKMFYRALLKKIIGKIISPEEEFREFKKLYKNALKLPKAVVLKTFKNMTYTYKLKEGLCAISQPTILIYGSEDRIVSKAAINELNDYIPKTELFIIDKGSHRTMYDNSVKVNGLIEKFIQ
ncbi:MAG: alpha/beta fold hydrolase [Promethearchaeota archaeon]